MTELLVAERMTNALTTTSKRLLNTSICWRLSSDRVAVLNEVWNADPTPPPAPTAGPPALHAINGRGLFIVDTLSAHWSWYAVPTVRGKVVWAEVGS